MSAQTPHPPVCLLSLDGGGIKGISELLILQHIMVAVQGRLQLPDEPRPRDYFDLTGGTSTGGLITIMLVRLGMTASEALVQYFKLAGKIFSKANQKRKGQDGTFKASTLEDSVKAIVMESSDGSRMLPSGDVQIGSKGFVCALAAENMTRPYHLRTYKVQGEMVYDCEIWEAARATTAAPTYFKALSITWPNGSKNRFVDAAFRSNNPTEEVIEEAQTIFGASTPLRILVSIGCGVKSIVRYEAPSALDKFLPKNVIKTLKDIALDCEKTSQNLERCFKHHSNVYFRFNIPEIGDIGLSEVDDSTLDRITASTKVYFDPGHPGHTMLKPVVDLLCNGSAGTMLTHDITLGKILTLTERSARGHQSLPFPRNENFVGREFYLDQLITKLDPKLHTNTCPWVALDGLGGIGKTQIALEVAYRIQDMYPECSTFWVQASDATSFNKSYREIAQTLGIPGLEDDKADVKHLVSTALVNLPSPWLLVIDNADDYEVLLNSNDTNGAAALITYLPNRGNGAVLFTTRDKKAAGKFAEANVIRIKKMNRCEATELFKNSVQEQSQSLLDNAVSITELLDLLLDLPLAIKQAAAFINENSTPISEYILFYKRGEQEIIEVLSEDFEDRGRYKNQKNPIATTWLISFTQMKRHNALAAEYLSYIGVILREDIHISLLPPEDSLLKRGKAIGTLIAYSFLTPRKEEQSYDVHRLVHLATRSWLSRDNELSIWEDRALHRLVEVLPEDGRLINREMWTRYLPHAIHLANAIKISKKNEMVTMALLHRLGDCQLDIGQYGEAEKIHRRALDLRERVIGKEHEDTLVSRNEIGLSLQYQGKYPEAEKIYREILTLNEKLLVQKDLDTLVTRHNLGAVLNSQGKYAESKKMVEETLLLEEAILGKDNPGTLASKFLLGSVLQAQGKLVEAEKIFNEVLMARKDIFGNKYPDTLISMNSLANTYHGQGRLKEAEDLHMQVLEIRKRMLGQEHPDTLSSMNNIADTYNSQGRWNKAEDLHKQVLEVRERVLGQEHPDTLGSMNNLAETYNSQGRWKEAEDLHKQVLEIQERVLGQEHPDTLRSMNNLAETYKSQARWKEAEDLHIQVLEVRERVLGQKHPATLTSMNNLADTYNSQGRWKKAEDLHIQVLEVQERVLGQEHPATLTSMNNLAWTYKDQGQDTKALSLMSTCVEISTRILGATHPRTLAGADAYKAWKEEQTGLSSEVAGSE